MTGMSDMVLEACWVTVSHLFPFSLTYLTGFSEHKTGTEEPLMPLSLKALDKLAWLAFRSLPLPWTSPPSGHQRSKKELFQFSRLNKNISDALCQGFSYWLEWLINKAINSYVIEAKNRCPSLLQRSCCLVNLHVLFNWTALLVSRHCRDGKRW